MARYTPESRERVRDAVDFVELVGGRTELRRAGARRYQGLCPFHDERTPSFGIDPVEKLYHCFGCGAGGDVFKFVMETESLDFAGALEAVADRYGVELEREAEDPRAAARRERRERLLALLERTATYYVRVLWEAPEAEAAREYLAGRGLDEGTLRAFRVGYSPSAWDRVLIASRRSGFSEDELQAAGLAMRGRGGGVYDRFRGRIMFPLCDTRGRVLGFGARAVRDNQQPKYLNSSDGDVFRKGRWLYAADLARTAAARAGSVVLVEGYTDVIALHQAGFENAAGLMGTALTEEQAAELGRLAPTVLLCLDADAAGREAMLRAAQLVAGRRGELRVVPLPPGSDPADIAARDGAEAVGALLERAVPFARFEVDRALDRGDLGSAEGRDRVVDELRPVFAGLSEGLLYGDLLKIVADRLDTSPDLLARALPPRSGAGAWRGGSPLAAGSSGAAGPPAAGQPAPPGARQAWDRFEDTERAFLARCLAMPEAAEGELASLDVDVLFASDLTRRAANYLRTHLHSPGEGLGDMDADLSRLIAELVVRAGALGPDSAALHLERLQLDKIRLDREIAAAQRRGEPVTELATERQRIHEEIRHRLV